MLTQEKVTSLKNYFTLAIFVEQRPCKAGKSEIRLKTVVSEKPGRGAIGDKIKSNMLFLEPGSSHPQNHDAS